MQQAADDDSDLVDLTGCREENDAVLLCYAAKHDWRQCREELAVFKDCFEKYVQSRNQ